jgi:hypothetical protein
MDTNVDALTIPDSRKEVTIARGHLEAAMALTITNNAELEQAIGAREQLDEMIKTAFDRLDKPRAAAYAAYKSTLELRDSVVDPLKEARKHHVDKVKRYTAEQEAKRQAEQRVAEEKARKEAEEEQLADAEAAEAAGDNEEAERIMDEPTIAVPVVVANITPKVDGRIYREKWGWKITDRTKIPPTFWKLNEPLINSTVRSGKGDTDIPGIEVYKV